MPKAYAFVHIKEQKITVNVDIFACIIYENWQFRVDFDVTTFMWHNTGNFEVVQFFAYI